MSYIPRPTRLSSSLIKPAEISAILREQLAGVKTETELQEVGTVLQVGDGIARIYGLSNV